MILESSNIDVLISVFIFLFSLPIQVGREGTFLIALHLYVDYPARIVI